MKIDAIYGKTHRLIEHAMGVRMMRQGLLASNIANADTPNYRAVDIDFKATMQEYMRETSKPPEPHFQIETAEPRHFELGQFTIPENELLRGIVFAAGDSLSVGNDSNSVNLEEQMARLQANSTLFSALTQILNKRIAGVKNIIESTSRI